VVELYPHQEKAVRELHNGSILFADMGVGKTITAAAYYMAKEAPRNVIVITTAKKRDSLDWQHDFGRYGVGERDDGTVAGTLTVDSWNNIGNYRDVEGSFFVFDEQRLVGSGQWTKDFLRIARRNRWILLSATPGDTWLDYIPVFVANGFYKNRTEFLREHVIYSRWAKFPKVERYVGVNKLVKHKNQILVHMPLERHTTRKVEHILVDYDQDQFKLALEDRWNPFSDRPLRDVAELFLVMRKVVNSSPTRCEAIRTLMSKHPKLIVFYNFDYELEALRSLANTIEKEKKSETTQEREQCLNEQIPTPANTESSDRLYPRQYVSTSSSASAATQLSTTSTSRNFNGSTTSTTTSGGDLPRKKSTTNNDSLPQDSDDSSTKSTAPIPERSSSFQAAERLSSSERERCISSPSTPKTFAMAEWNGHKHQPIPETDSWLYLVQYQAGAEGWNCIETNAMAFYSLTYSYKNWYQAHGRTDRLNTPYNTLYYYVLMSNSIIDRAIMKSLKAKKSFNESKWLKSIPTRQSQKLPKTA